MALYGCQQEFDLVGELGDFLVGAVHAFVGLFIGESELFGQLVECVLRGSNSYV